MLPQPQPVERDRPMSKTALIARLADAQPGDQIIYWRGHIAFDSCLGRGMREVDRYRLRCLARLAWDMATDGRVDLVQSRIAPGACAYIAIARRQPVPRATFVQPIQPMMEAA